MALLNQHLDQWKHNRAFLASIAAEIRIVSTSAAPKGDVYDYLTEEDHSADDLLALIEAAIPVNAGDLADGAAPSRRSNANRA